MTNIRGRNNMIEETNQINLNLQPRYQFPDLEVEAGWAVIRKKVRTDVSMVLPNNSHVSVKLQEE